MHLTLLTKLETDRTEVRKRIVGDTEVPHLRFSDKWYCQSGRADVRSLYNLYRRPHEVIPGLIDDPRTILAFGHPPEHGICSHKSEGWVFPPTDVLLIDGDGIPYPDGYSDETLVADPRRTITAVLATFGLDEAECLVVLSSKSGLTGAFRAHIFIQLDAAYTHQDLNYLLQQAKEQHPWIDPVMRPAHTLISCRPLLEHEHLPERVFYFPSDKVFKPPVASAQGLVELKKVPVRGKTSQSYRLDEDRIRNSEWVTEECWNFVLSCKRARMSEEETVAALHAEFERIGAPRDTWKRMWKPIKSADGGEQLDPTLGDARRMYRQQHQGAGTVYGQPAYREPETTLEDATRQMRDAIMSQVEREGVFLNKVSLGVGKTHEIVEFATREDRKVLILAPNHERCKEIAARLEAARTKRMDEIFATYDNDLNALADEEWVTRQWQVWRGRSAEGMCDRLDVVNEAFRAGINVGQDVCGFPTEKDPDRPRCPHWMTCAYWDQVMTFWKYNWVVPVAMVSHLSRVAAAADFIIVDEGCVDYLAGQRTVDLEDLLAPRLPRLDELSRRAYIDLLDGTRVLSLDELREALDLEYSLRVVPEVSPDMDDDEIVARCDPGKYRASCVSLWRGMISEHAGGQNHIFVYHYEEEVDGRKVARWRAKVSWRNEPKLFSQVKTVLLFDATPNVTALKAHFPELEVFEFSAPAQNTHVVQCADIAGKRSSILNPLQKEHKEWSKVEKGYIEKRAHVADWLRAQPGYTVVVTKKDYRECMEREQRFKRVAFAHYGAVEGKDLWEFPDGTRLRGAEIDNLVLIGRSAPPPFQMEDEARKHHCDEDAIQCIGKWYKDVPVELSGGVASSMPVHPDPRVDAVFKAVWRDTQMQAFGRGRSVRRDRRLRVFILHNMPLEVTVAETVTGAQLMRRCGDATLLSPKEVDRVFGRGGEATRRALQSVVATHKYWRDEGQTQPYRCAVAGGADVDAVMGQLGALRWAEA